MEKAQELGKQRTAYMRRRSAVDAGQHDAFRASAAAVSIANRNPFLHSVSLANLPESVGDWPVSGDDLALAKAGRIA